MPKPTLTNRPKELYISIMPTQKKPTIGIIAKFIILVNILLSISICSFFLYKNYLSVKNAPAPEVIEKPAAKKQRQGIIIDLGEFMMSLKNTDRDRFLKINVIVELSKTIEEIEANLKVTKKEGHGENQTPSLDTKTIETLMNVYKPPMKDAVLEVLSNKTYEELLDNEGKELAKEDIAKAVNKIFKGKRTVIRINFSNFVMQ